MTHERPQAKTDFNHMFVYTLPDRCLSLMEQESILKRQFSDQNLRKVGIRKYLESLEFHCRSQTAVSHVHKIPEFLERNGNLFSHSSLLLIANYLPAYGIYFLTSEAMSLIKQYFSAIRVFQVDHFDQLLPSKIKLRSNNLEFDWAHVKNLDIQVTAQQPWAEIEYVNSILYNKQLWLGVGITS